MVNSPAVRDGAPEDEDPGEDRGEDRGEDPGEDPGGRLDAAGGRLLVPSVDAPE
jgi:hypothetical protein